MYVRDTLQHAPTWLGKHGWVTERLLPSAPSFWSADVKPNNHVGNHRRGRIKRLHGNRMHIRLWRQLSHTILLFWGCWEGFSCCNGLWWSPLKIPEDAATVFRFLWADCSSSSWPLSSAITTSSAAACGAWACSQRWRYPLDMLAHSGRFQMGRDYR